MIKSVFSTLLDTCFIFYRLNNVVHIVDNKQNRSI